jgi:prevent-host-death family protein
VNGVADEVSIRDLRNKGGEVVDRVSRGERITITKAGRRVAELRPIRQPGIAASVLLERWRHLPAVDPTGVRADIDRFADASL